MTLPSGKEEENSEKIPQRDLSGISRRINPTAHLFLRHISMSLASHLLLCSSDSSSTGQENTQ